MSKSSVTAGGASAHACSGAGMSGEAFAELVHGLAWRGGFLAAEEGLGDLLLALRALTYTDDALARENLLLAAEHVLTPYSRRACDALDALVLERREEAEAGAPS